MTRIAFIAACMIVAGMSSASAGSDHYGAGNTDRPTVDRIVTGSVPMADVGRHHFQPAVNSGESAAHLIVRHNDDGLWGR